MLCRQSLLTSAGGQGKLLKALQWENNLALLALSAVLLGTGMGTGKATELRGVMSVCIGSAWFLLSCPFSKAYSIYKTSRVGTAMQALAHQILTSSHVSGENRMALRRCPGHRVWSAEGPVPEPTYLTLTAHV